MSKKGGQRPKDRGQKPRKGSSGAEIRLSNHPRAKHQIRLAKGWAGLAGSALAGYASWHGGAPFLDTVLRDPSDPSKGTIPFHKQIYDVADLYTTRARTYDYAAYAQDEWHPNGRLTIDLRTAGT